MILRRVDTFFRLMDTGINLAYSCDIGINSSNQMISMKSGNIPPENPIDAASARFAFGALVLLEYKDYCTRRYSPAVEPVSCRKIRAKCWLVAKPQSLAIWPMLRSESFSNA
jgi:hypothetical protein